MTPIQRWFFRDYKGNLTEYDQAVLLAPRASIDEHGLRAVLEALADHHDGLRLVFPGNRACFRKRMAPTITCIDLRGAREPSTVLLDHIDRIRSGYDLAKGPLFRAVYFRLAAGDRLLLAMHHLVVDAVSWRILLADLAHGLNLTQNGLPPRFSPKTDSFQIWSRRLRDRELSRAERAYWRTVISAETKHLEPNRKSPDKAFDHWISI